MYLTAQDLEQAFSEKTLIELTNDSSRATDIDYERLTAAMQQATETVDGYLRSRYLLPLETVPTLVRHIALQIARYWLYSRRPEGKLPDNVKETYSQALKDLSAIQNGKLHLGLATSQAPDLVADALKFKARSGEKMDLSGY